MTFGQTIMGTSYMIIRNPNVGNFFDKRYPIKSGTNLTETQEHLNMAVTTKKAPCFNVASW